MAIIEGLIIEADTPINMEQAQFIKDRFHSLEDAGSPIYDDLLDAYPEAARILALP